MVPLTHTGRLWVTANFRETQIQLMKPGQKASVHVDAIDRDYNGAVESFAGATGSRYSLLPTENASGNYVKGVQRLPVRISLDPGQPELERLRPGMSVEPKLTARCAGGPPRTRGGAATRKGSPAGSTRAPRARTTPGALP